MKSFAVLSLCLVLLSSLSCTKEVLVTSVSFNSTELTMNVGQKKTLQAAVLPTEATNTELTWKSSNLVVASVSDGVVTALGGGSAVISATANNGVSAECKVTVLVPVESVSFKSAVLEMGEGKTQSLDVTILPENASDKQLSWNSSNEDVAIVEKGSITAKREGKTVVTATSSNGRTASLDVYVNAIKNGQYCVDLGLSVMWATFNVGAYSRDNYGDLFAWGETETKTDFRWQTYKYCQYQPYSDLLFTKYVNSSKYGTVDSKTVLDYSDDVVAVSWGGGWRMPTAEELQELADNCSFTWVEIGETKGVLLTSKVKGYQDKSVFFPASGSNDGGYYGGKNSTGYYWSKSLSGITTDAKCAYFTSTSQKFSDFNTRYRGHAVRGVTK